MFLYDSFLKGFLSFLVWVGDKAGLYTYVAKIPGSFSDHNDDFLHLIEDVHIHLFISMCLYMGSLIRVINLAKNTMNSWKRSEFEVFHGRGHKTAELEHFKMMRGMFLTWVKYGGHFSSRPSGDMTFDR